jgi:uncharacterized protein DUF3558
VTVRLLLVPIVAAAALVLAGCSQQTAGDATAAGDRTDRPTIPGGTGDPTDPSETSDGDSGTADLQPCDMLTSDEQAQLQVTGGTEEVVGPERSCEWKKSDSYTVAVGIVDDLGLEDVQSSTPTKPMKVGSHDAVQSTGGVSSCAVNIGVTDSSRVDVISAANGDVQAACVVAKQAAQLVEPKLP